MIPIAYVYNNLCLEGQKLMGFGKHRGDCYEYVYMRDRNYCNWCLTIEAPSFLLYDFQQYIYKMDYFR